MSIPHLRSAMTVRGSRISVSTSAAARAGSVLVGVGRPAARRHVAIASSCVPPMLAGTVGDADDVPVGAALVVPDADELDDEVDGPGVDEPPQPASAAATSVPGTTTPRTGHA
jgi:hypothetical protein